MHISKREPSLKSLLIIFFGLLFLIIFSLRYNPLAFPFENGVYASYTESFINDGDINIHNNVLNDDMNWMVTKTYNNPDMHDHGIIMMWSPFFLYTKMLDFFKIETRFEYSKAQDISQTIATIFFAILGILLTRNWVYRLKPKTQRIRNVIAAVIIATPFLWYALFHPRNSDLSAFAFASFWLVACDVLLRRTKNMEWLLMGFLLAIGYTIKVTMLFYLLLVGFYLLNYSKSQKWQKKLSLFISFAIGTLSVLGFFFINQYLKFGMVPLLGTYFETTQFSHNIAQELLFGPNGYLYLCPFMFLILFIFVHYLILIIRRELLTEAEKLSLVLFTAIPIKLTIEAFGFCESTDFGPRHYIIDFPVMVLLLHNYYERIEERSKKYLFGLKTAIAISIAWSFLMYLWINIVSERQPYQWGAYYINEIFFIEKSLQIYIQKIATTFSGFAYYLINFLPYTPIVLLCAYLINKILSVKLWSEIALKIVISYFIFFYALVTFSNLKNNQKNVNIIKEQGGFRQVLVADGFELYLYDELISSIGRVLAYSKISHNRERFDYNHKVLESYVQKIQNQILIDPIKFKLNLSTNNLRASYHETWNKPNDFQDYKIPVHNRVQDGIKNNKE